MALSSLQLVNSVGNRDGDNTLGLTETVCGCVSLALSKHHVPVVSSRPSVTPALSQTSAGDTPVPYGMFVPTTRSVGVRRIRSSSVYDSAGFAIRCGICNGPCGGPALWEEHIV